MVDHELIENAKKIFGSSARKFLVTGATGFVGHRVAQALSLAGQVVTATGRNHYLAPPDVPFVKADLRNRDEVSSVCQGQDIIVHCASNTSPWGPYEKLAATNVDGTKNIIESCLRHGVERLVHVSSTSLQFDFKDNLEISEHDPLPKKFACNYAKSKWYAEEAVREECARGLNAIIIRARAVFGPGDQSLMPRMLSVFDKGRLRQIGNGANVTDLTYIDNLVFGLLLAIDQGEAGTTCTVTGEDPVPIWKLIRQILEATERKRKLKTIPYSIAKLAASVSEILHKTMRKRGEPTLTRYAVGLLAKSQTFNTMAARRELGYRPIISMSQGIQRTVNSLNRNESSHTGVRVRMRLFTTGFTRQQNGLVERGGEKKTVAFHALFALIEHPDYGITLFDTGYSPRIYEATMKWPYRAYAKITPVVTSDEVSCVSRLADLGVQPSQVDRIVLSHLHADHVCGLHDFPEADIVVSKTAWESVSGKKGISAVKNAFLPGLIPENIKDRLFLLPSFDGPGIGPFRNSHDLFSDGSLKLLEIPGHADGQIGLLLQSGESDRTFLVADAAWSTRTITENLKPTFAFRAIASNAREALMTLSTLNEFHRQFPDVKLIPTHCRAVAEEYEFDQQFSGLLEVQN